MKPNLIRWAFVVSVGVIAFYAAKPYSDSAPLGAPLPGVPVVVEHLDVTIQDSSLMAGRLNERLLELLAPQADGVPPLIRPYTSKSAGFTIGHPYGTENTIFLQDKFFKDGALSQSFVHYGMPLEGIKYGLPENSKDDKVTVYVSRFRQELESSGATFIARQGVVQLEGYRFETLEYERLDETGDKNAHFMFFGPFGSRVLIIDFVAPAGNHELAKPYVAKIINSFEPGEKLLGLLEEITQSEQTSNEVETEDNNESGDA